MRRSPTAAAISLSSVLFRASAASFPGSTAFAFCIRPWQRRDRQRKKTKNRIMDDRIIELLYRNLQDVFGEGDAARRRAAIENLYIEDCMLCVPPGVFVGHDTLDKFAGDLRATHPDFVYTPHGEPQAVHDAGILAWGSGPKGEAPDYTGLDVIIVRDSKIAALYVFLNPKFA
jgi:hypothetical protein